MSDFIATIAINAVPWLVALLITVVFVLCDLAYRTIADWLENYD